MVKSSVVIIWPWNVNKVKTNGWWLVGNIRCDVPSFKVQWFELASGRNDWRSSFQIRAFHKHLNVIHYQAVFSISHLSCHGDFIMCKLTPDDPDFKWLKCDNGKYIKFKKTMWVNCNHHCNLMASSHCVAAWKLFFCIHFLHNALNRCDRPTTFALTGLFIHNRSGKASFLSCQVRCTP